MANCGRVGCCGNKPYTLKVGDVVRWTEADIVARYDEHSRPYARKARGIVEAVVNGGWDATIQWRRARTTVDIRRIAVATC